MTPTTVGVEHEWADFPLSTPLPKGYGRDIKDYTIVNSNGIANDPSGKCYGFGGEINTPPTDNANGQVECLLELKKLFPMAKVNYRSNLHVHVRVPGLKDDLATLKRMQSFIHQTMPRLLKLIEPIPQPDRLQFDTEEEFLGARRRYRRRLVSHRTLLTVKRVDRQMAARTVEEFFAAEVPHAGGKPMWHMQPRLCVNLRQMLQTDTVEFRHFPGTLDPTELKTCIDWCVLYLGIGLDGYANGQAGDLIPYIKRALFPTFPPYVHWMENRYRATCHDGTVTKAMLVANIRAIEEGTFDEFGKLVP